MKEIQSYRDLDVWNVGMELVIATYGVARKLPSGELYGLSAQMRRAAISVPSNVAEGHAHGKGAYRNHVRIALGSTAELETQMEAAVRLGLVDRSDVGAALELATRVGQMLNRLSTVLRSDHKRRLQSAFALLGGTLAAGLLTFLR